MARYPDGVTADTVGFHEFDFLYGNNFLALPWQGTSADMRELALQETQNAPVSPFMGFVADLSDMSNTLASLSATKTEYYNRRPHKSSCPFMSANLRNAVLHTGPTEEPGRQWKW